MKDYFQGIAEQPAPRPTILPLILWAGVVACVLFIAAGLSGCATEPKEAPKSGPWTRICSVQPLGQTDSGVPVVGLVCITQEEFAELQK